MKPNASVLLIDDSILIHRLLDAWLAKTDLNLWHAYDGVAGIRLACQYRPGLILLDMQLMAEDGLDICSRLRSKPATASIPIVFLSGTDDPAQQRAALERGAVAFIHKPFKAPQIRAGIEAALSRAPSLLANGHCGPECSADTQPGEGDVVGDTRSLQRALRWALQRPAVPGVRLGVGLIEVVGQSQLPEPALRDRLIRLRGPGEGLHQLGKTQFALLSPRLSRRQLQTRARTLASRLSEAAAGQRTATPPPSVRESWWPLGSGADPRGSNAAPPWTMGDSSDSHESPHPQHPSKPAEALRALV